MSCRPATYPFKAARSDERVKWNVADLHHQAEAVCTFCSIFHSSCWYYVWVGVSGVNCTVGVKRKHPEVLTELSVIILDYLESKGLIFWKSTIIRLTNLLTFFRVFKHTRCLVLILAHLPKLMHFTPGSSTIIYWITIREKGGEGGSLNFFFSTNGSGWGKSPGTWPFYLDENQCKDVCRTRVAVVRHNDVIEVYSKIRFQSKNVLLIAFYFRRLLTCASLDDGRLTLSRRWHWWNY